MRIRFANRAALLSLGALTIAPAVPIRPPSPRLAAQALSPFVIAQERVRPDGGGLPYLGQPRPGDTPVVFASGNVSTDARELGIAFAPDGREIYYTRVVEKLPMLFRRRFVNGTWTAEERLTLVAGQPEADHSDPAISPDGQRLYFVSGARNEAFKPGGNIWMSRREGSAWSKAVLLPPPVNSDGGELYPIVVADGSLYFASNRTGGLGEQDIYRAQYRDGNRGALDLYVAGRSAAGSWEPLTPMGDAVNTELTDYCPMLSPDGQYFFFSRRTAQGGDIYWMRASAIDHLRARP